MINIILQIFICGIATAAICRTVAYYEGPFHIFPRLREALLPRAQIFDPIWDINNVSELEETFSEMLISDQQIEAQRELWKVYHLEHNPRFYLSLRGTIYGVLDCPFCMGPYVAFVMALINTGYYWTLASIEWANWTFFFNFILVWLGSFGLHFMITKRWESRDV